jgi:hypothetical protein
VTIMKVKTHDESREVRIHPCALPPMPSAGFGRDRRFTGGIRNSLTRRPLKPSQRTLPQSRIRPHLL